MDVVVFSFAEKDRLQFADLYYQFLKLRKRVFVDLAGWSLQTSGQLEIDQYDNPNATYVLIHIDGVVVAGSRVIPADQSFDGWTNLLRDSALGKIPGIESTVFPDGFDFGGSCECSRLLVDADALSPAQSTEAFRLMGAALIGVAADRNIGCLMSLSPPALRRRFRQVGFVVGTVGRRYLCPDDGKSYQVLALAM